MFPFKKISKSYQGISVQIPFQKQSCPLSDVGSSRVLTFYQSVRSCSLWGQTCLIISVDVCAKTSLFSRLPSLDCFHVCWAPAGLFTLKHFYLFKKKELKFVPLSLNAICFIFVSFSAKNIQHSLVCLNILCIFFREYFFFHLWLKCEKYNSVDCICTAAHTVHYCTCEVKVREVQRFFSPEV